MRTLDSLRRQETKLRQKHTEQAAAGQWLQAQTTRGKLITVLNAIKELEETANKILPKP